MEKLCSRILDCENNWNEFRKSWAIKPKTQKVDKMIKWISRKVLEEFFEYSKHYLCV